MLRAHSRSLAPTKPPVFTCSFCSIRPPPATRRSFHSSSPKAGEYDFPLKQRPAGTSGAPRKETARGLQDLLRSNPSQAAQSPPGKWGNFVQRDGGNQAPSRFGGDAPTPAPAPRLQFGKSTTTRPGFGSPSGYQAPTPGGPGNADRGFGRPPVGTGYSSGSSNITRPSFGERAPPISRFETPTPGGSGSANTGFGRPPTGSSNITRPSFGERAPSTPRFEAPIPGGPGSTNTGFGRPPTGSSNITRPSFGERAPPTSRFEAPTPGGSRNTGSGWGNRDGESSERPLIRRPWAASEVVHPEVAGKTASNITRPSAIPWKERESDPYMAGVTAKESYRDLSARYTSRESGSGRDIGDRRGGYSDKGGFTERRGGSDRFSDRGGYSDRGGNSDRGGYSDRGTSRFSGRSADGAPAEAPKKKKPWEIDTPPSNKFASEDSYSVPRREERVEDARYQKKVAAREKDRSKNRRGFVDEAAAVIDQSDRLSKEEKRLRKEKRERERREAQARTLIPIMLPQFITVENLATRLNTPLNRFTRRLADMGYEDVNGNHVLNAEDSGLIAGEFGYEVIVDRAEEFDIRPRPQPAPEDKHLLPTRPPVVTIMGHVDHGKTTLLDWLRKSSIVDTEHGGITQHIGAFSVTMPSGKVITFLDTPGHAAFLSMRERGANVTDIVILVVAADDSVKPQTLEAIKHAKGAGVPMIVAINKCDKEGANPDRVKQDLARYGVELEDIGGDTQSVCVSGKTGMGMDELEEATVLLGEILDHRAETDGQVEGWVLEATTRKHGRVATILVTRGTLRVGDILVAGKTWTRVRTLKDEHGNEVGTVLPGHPVEVDGWRDQPEAGELALQAENEDKAKRAIDYRVLKFERIQQAIDMEAINKSRREAREKLEKEEAIRAAAVEAGEDPEEALAKALKEEANGTAPKQQEVPVIIKADVDGSVEACVDSISSLGNDEVRPRILRSGFGEITEFDIDHAAAAGAYVISFNLTIDPNIFQYARARRVTILAHNIIYRLVDDVKDRLSERLPPKITQHTLGEAEILQIFNYNVKGRQYKPVAGCRIKNGTITRNGKYRVIRKGETVHEGELASLKNVKKDVQEMKKGGECGLSFEGWTEFETGDLVQCYEVREEKRFLP